MRKILTIIFAVSLTFIYNQEAYAQAILVQPLAPIAPAIATAGSGYPAGATATGAFATGTTAGTTATLAANATKFNYICEIHVEIGTATTAIPVTVTITGLVGGTFTTSANAPVTSATATAGPIIPQVFTPCAQSSAINTAIVVSASALGTGGVNQNVNALGYVQ